MKQETVYRGTIEYFCDDLDVLTSSIFICLMEPISTRLRGIDGKDIVTVAGSRSTFAERIADGTRFYTHRFYCDQAAWDKLQAEGNRFTTILDS